jgi:hypothetical protein
MGLAYDGCFVTSTPYLNRDHSYEFASSVGHPMSDLVGLLVYDGMHVYNIRGTDVVLQVPRDSVNSARKDLIYWIDHMRNNYDFICIYVYIMFSMH